MDFRQMRYFQAAAEERSISGASKRLHISQPPLSRQIKSMEQELGIFLFHRTAKGLELTEAGELFYERTMALEKQYNEIIEELAEFTKEHPAAIRLGTVDFSKSFLEPLVLRILKRRFPEAVFASVTGTAEEILQKLKSGETDMALLRYPFENSSAYNLIRLTNERWQAMMPCTHPFADKAVTPETLREENLILPSRKSLYKPILQALGLEDGSVNILCYYFDMLGSQQLAKQMNAIVIVPDILKKGKIDGDIIFKEIDGLMLDTCYMAVRRKEENTIELLDRCWDILRMNAPIAEA